MKTILIALAAFIGLLVLGFIAWLTGGSPPAFLAGIFLLGFAAGWAAVAAGILTLPALVRTILGWATILCLAVVVFATIRHQWRTKVTPRVEAARAKKELEEQIRAQARAARRAQQAQHVQAGKENRSFQFADYRGGCVVVYLNDDVRFYPLGGPITIESGGKIWKVDPQVPAPKQNLRGMKAGVYTVCPDGPGATNVDILTSWAAQPSGLN